MIPSAVLITAVYVYVYVNIPTKNSMTIGGKRVLYTAVRVAVV